mmetsp:Transcript_36889/g.44075  ORF Transcript_36889/g.44075 Transcript_36889/m.44075 type:complete len:110 (+) Transcript_36889:464-793(+)
MTVIVDTVHFSNLLLCEHTCRENSSFSLQGHPSLPSNHPKVDLAYRSFKISAISSISIKARSKSFRVWPAEMQKRALDRRIGTAGNPTTTTARPRFKHSLEKAAIFVGL